MRIYLTTEKGIMLGLSNIAKKNYGESRYSAEFRFRQLVGNALHEQRLKVINENSIRKFTKVNKVKYETKDAFGNIEYLYIYD